MKTPRSTKHTVGAHALLPFAQDEATTRMVHISEVERGLACGCVCPHCSAPLIARRGPEKADHFAHQPGAECAAGAALESMLHKVAKQIISTRLEVYLPPVVARAGHREKPLKPGQVFRPDEVREEVYMPGLRPDIVARRRDRDLLIEVFVTNRCGPEKIALLRERNLPCVEIDLSGLKDITDREEIEKAILHTADRQWLHNALIVEETDAWERREEEYRKEREAAVRVVADAINAAAAEPVDHDVRSPSVAGALQFIEDTDLQDAANVSVQGEGVFRVPRAFWQAPILQLLEAWHGADSFRGTTEQIINAAGVLGLVGYAARRALLENGLEWKAVAPYLNSDIRPPAAVVTDYLTVLADLGIATRGKRDTWGMALTVAQQSEEKRREAERARRLLKPVEAAFDRTVRILGSSPGAFNDWVQREFAGTGHTIHDAVIASERASSAIISHLGRIAALAAEDSEPVDDGLMGFPVEELNERARADKRVRLNARSAPQAIAIPQSVVLEGRGAAGERYDEVVAYAVKQLGTVHGLALHYDALDCLGGFSLDSMSQQLSAEEAAGVKAHIDALKLRSGR